ncbi:YraN family protein [Arenimonas sp.]|uniref:YraN family protein n=1 Tax=Arenimonas sp. TaxID=1872635 RepID=UPI0039E21692
MAAERQASGAAAEDAACMLLQRAGLKLLERNARYPFGELDLVMLDAATLVFVEVRLRRDPRFGGAAASIDLGKRRKLALAAQAWLAANPRHGDAPCRFDVVAATPAADGLQCEWIRNAFTMDDL